MAAYRDRSADDGNEMTDNVGNMETTARYQDDMNQGARNLKSQTECVKLFAQKLQALADEYGVEINRKYKAGSWQAKCANKLKTALAVLQFLVKFLDTPEGQKAVEFSMTLLAKLTESIKRFAEFLGPVLISFGISIYLCQADAQFHESTLKCFEDDIQAIDMHLKRLTDIMPKLTNMIAEAGEQLEAFIQDYEETGMQEESSDLEKLFLKISAEMDIANDRLREIEKCLIKVQRDVDVYKRDTFRSRCILSVGVCTVSLLFARYTDLLTSRTAVIVSAASVVPLVHSHFLLRVDINDVLGKIRRKQNAQRLFRCELDDLERRLNVLQKTNMPLRVFRSNALYTTGRCNSLPIGTRSPNLKRKL